MSETMRAVVLERPGEPMAVETIARPSPLDGEVLVQVHGCGVCHSDLHVMKGELAFPTPCVLGHEVAGIVVERGPGVVNCAVGDRVVSSFIMPCGTCRQCVRGRDELCETFFAVNRGRGTLYDGTTRLHRADGTPLAMYSMAGLAEYAVVPDTDIFAVPEELELASAAVLGCAVFTAYGAAGAGVDVAFEALGRPQTVQQAFKMARDGGTVVAVGIGAGAAAAEIEITHMVRREIRLLGSFGARTRADMPRVIALAAAGAIDLERLISARVGLEQAEETYRALERGAVSGRALVVP